MGAGGKRFETLVEAGYSADAGYSECLHEVKAVIV